MKFFIYLIIIFSTSSNLLAAEFRDSEVESYISNFCNDVIIISTLNVNKDKKLSKLIDVIDNNVDSGWISRFVLGKHYRSFSKDSFNKFSKLYRQYMINAYAPKFLNYEGVKCTVISVADQKLFYNVKTEFLSADNPKPFDVSFRVKIKKEKFFIIDFIPEGISLLESQRGELDSSINKLGVKGFIEDLSVKVDDLIKSNNALSNKR